MGDRLDGGRDRGAELVDGTVRRPVRAWTPSVHRLLEHLEQVRFARAPRARGTDAEGREVLTHLVGETVGAARPWPAWTHDDETLTQVAAWLRGYHDAVAAWEPAPDSVWRAGGVWQPGLVVAHGDAAPYNAVWDGRLVGFFDWDDAGPVSAESDLAWVAFSWTPLHASEVVCAEGFTARGQRRRRLELFLAAYGWAGSVGEVLDLVEARLVEQVASMRRLAATGDPAYVAMLGRGQDRQLETAREELASL